MVNISKTRDTFVLFFFNNIYNFICSFCSTEKGSSFYNLSPPIEQNGNPDVSPVSANDDGGDVAMSNRNNDDMDDNDPFSKRRY